METKEIDLKGYQEIYDEIPCVNDSGGTYLYLSGSKPAHLYLELLDKVSHLNVEDVSGWLNITPKTYRSYRKNQDAVLKDNLKEHLILILSLYRHGIETFGNRAQFEKWLTTPNILLDNKLPHQLLDTISGIRFIDNRLTAMEFGDNA